MEDCAKTPTAPSFCFIDFLLKYQSASCEIISDGGKIAFKMTISWVEWADSILCNVNEPHRNNDISV